MLTLLSVSEIEVEIEIEIEIVPTITGYMIPVVLFNFTVYSMEITIII